MKFVSLIAVASMFSMAAAGCAANTEDSTSLIDQGAAEAEVETSEDALGRATVTAKIVALDVGVNSNIPTFEGMFSGPGLSLRRGGTLIVQNAMFRGFNLELHACSGGTCTGGVVARGSVGGLARRNFVLSTPGLYQVSVAGVPGSGYRFVKVNP